MTSETIVAAADAELFFAEAFPNARPKLKGVALIDGHPETAKVLRSTKRRAVAAGVAWEALAVETPASHDPAEMHDNGFLAENIAMAEQMGAPVTVIFAAGRAEGVSNWIEESRERGETVAFIKVGHSRGGGFFSSGWRWDSVAVLKKRMAEKGVPVVPVPLGEDYAARPRLQSMFRISGGELASGMAMALGAGLLVFALEQIWPPVSRHGWSSSRSIIFVIACAFAAVRHGLAAGAFAAFSGFMILNSLFVNVPTGFSEAEETAGLILFVLGTGALSLLGNYEHQRKRALAKRAERFHSLLSMHRTMLNRKDREDASGALSRELSKWLETDVAFFFPRPGEKRGLDDSRAESLGLQECDLAALHACWEENRTSGACSPYNPACAWRFEPMQTAGNEIGVMGVRITEKAGPDVDYGKLLSGVADQAALILERLELEQRAEATRMHAEREQLRSMLLSSVSHDLKTPLASVIGSLSVYRSMGGQLPPEQRATLIDTALEEAQRLDSFITNILDMTRLESGVVEMKREWIRFDVLASEVRSRLRDRMKAHPVRILPGPAVEVQADVMMTGQVIQNLLDNAAKYTPPGTPVDMFWEADEKGFRFTVRDRGAGVPEEDSERIFDKYARIRRRDNQAAGTGLGLAISRAVMKAQGGDIKVESVSGGGAAFTFHLPHWRRAEDSGERE